MHLAAANAVTSMKQMASLAGLRELMVLEASLFIESYKGNLPASVVGYLRAARAVPKVLLGSRGAHKKEKAFSNFRNCLTAYVNCSHLMLPGN